MDAPHSAEEGLKRQALVALCATAACSFAAHGFLFSNELFSHDSISYFTYATGTPAFYCGLGRFAIPVYELLKGAVAAPWLIGLLFVGWMSLAALAVIRLLEIRSRAGVILTCGLLCANQALTLTGATYIYCMDEYALSLLAAAAAVWMFTRGRWWTVGGLGCLTLSLAVYQAYFTAAACLCLLVVLTRLAANAPVREVLRASVRYLALLAAGFLLYYGAWTLLCALMGIEKQRLGESFLGGNALGQLLPLLADANVEYLRRLFDGGGVLGRFLPLVHLLLVLLLLWRLACLLGDRRLALGNKLLLAVLVCLLPTAFNSVAILTVGSHTQLMTYAGELFYLLPVLLMERVPAAERRTAPARTSPVRLAAGVLLCCVLWQHVVYANQVYMKKDLEKNATLVLAARMLDRIEGTEGYVPGVTPVAFVGRLDQNNTLNRGRNAFQELDHTVGLWSDYAATYNLGRYVTDYLNAPLVWDTASDYSRLEEVAAMPAFPAAGAVEMIDGTVVVKLS